MNTGVVARIVTGPHEANRQDPHLPMRYDTGRPRAVIRLRISQPRTTSLPCPAGLRARRPSPMMDLYRKNAFSTRVGACAPPPEVLSRCCGRRWRGSCGRSSHPPGALRRRRFLNLLPHLDTPPARTLSQSSVQENSRAQEAVSEPCSRRPCPTRCTSSGWPWLAG